MHARGVWGLEDATGVMAKSEKAFATKNGWYLWCRMYDMKMTATDTEACPGSRRHTTTKVPNIHIST
jgi:hypothetical protein